MSIIPDCFRPRRWRVIHRAYKIRKYVHYLMKGLEHSASTYEMKHLGFSGVHTWPNIRERFKNKRYMK